MSIFSNYASPRPKGFPLRGPDGTFKHGDTTFTRERSPETWVGEGTWNSFPDEYQVTVDRPGEKDDVVLSVFDDFIRVRYPNRPDMVSIYQKGDSIEVERLSRRESATLSVEGDTLAVDRFRRSDEVKFKDKGYRFEIDRSKPSDDVKGNARRIQKGADKLPSAEALDFVDEVLDKGLSLENMVTLGLDGRVTFWDQKLR